MRLTFLGTAAATACPLPFCRCAACTAAREAGGKDCRARSSLLVNQDLLLDLGPDAPASALRLRFHAAEPGKALRLGHYHILPLPSAHDPAGGSLPFGMAKPPCSTGQIRSFSMPPSGPRCAALGTSFPARFWTTPTARIPPARGI